MGFCRVFIPQTEESPFYIEPLIDCHFHWGNLHIGGHLLSSVQDIESLPKFCDIRFVESDAAEWYIVCAVVYFELSLRNGVFSLRFHH